MGFRIAIIGATGLVGEKLLKLLAERAFPVSSIYLFATGKGKKSAFFGSEQIQVRTLHKGKIPEVHFAFFSAGTDIPKQYARKFVQRGAVVIDNSPAFREDPHIPLVIPEINPHHIQKKHRIIANPNCSTIIMLMPLFPLYKQFGIRRIIAATYQSVTGAGRDALLDLAMKRKIPKYFSLPIHRNVIPHIGSVRDTGFTSEERKMSIETWKMLSDKSVKISATCARVPVRVGHCISATLELNQPFNLKAIRQAMAAFPGVVVYDDMQQNRFPYPLLADDKDEVFVGRIRRDPVFKNGLSLWIAGDNLRKGAATNAIQIAELVVTKRYVIDRR
jgi:aspartate-semialdehyde dehydrogenase